VGRGDRGENLLRVPVRQLVREELLTRSAGGHESRRKTALLHPPPMAGVFPGMTISELVTRCQSRPGPAPCQMLTAAMRRAATPRPPAEPTAFGLADPNKCGRPAARWAGRARGAMNLGNL